MSAVPVFLLEKTVFALFSLKLAVNRLGSIIIFHTNSIDIKHELNGYFLFQKHAFLTTCCAGGTCLRKHDSDSNFLLPLAFEAYRGDKGRNYFKKYLGTQ
jgi:hypothetical protein